MYHNYRQRLNKRDFIYKKRFLQEAIQAIDVLLIHIETCFACQYSILCTILIVSILTENVLTPGTLSSPFKKHKSRAQNYKDVTPF